LRVEKNGSRRWVQRIVIKGKRCELGLGSPPALSLASARKLALENRGKVMQGGDPLVDRRKVRQGLTRHRPLRRWMQPILAINPIPDEPSQCIAVDNVEQQFAGRRIRPDPQ
jgi:Arm DNA-binding domain